MRDEQSRCQKVPGQLLTWDFLYSLLSQEEPEIPRSQRYVSLDKSHSQM